MTHYCKHTKHPPARVIQKAIDFFGPKGLGLQIKEKSQDKDSYSTFLGANEGHVFLKASKNEKGSEVEIETNDLDPQVEQFLEKVK